MGECPVNKCVNLGIEFQAKGNDFIATVSIQDLTNVSEDINSLLKWASETYGASTKKMVSILIENEKIRRHGQKIPAVFFWDLGNTIFKLLENLSSRGLDFEDLYGHLVRDLHISRSTIKRAIALRRYVPEREMLSPDVAWGACKDAPKKFASGLLRRNK
jgi:hypothetical protein